MRLLLSLALLWLITINSAQAAIQLLHTAHNKTIYTLPGDTLPMAVMELRFAGTGSISDPASKTGRAYFGAKMLMEGSADQTAQQFRQALENKAIRLSVSANQEDLIITIQCLSKHLPDTLELVTQMLTQPRFSSVSIEQIRQKIISQLKKRHQNPGWLANYHFDKTAYGDHPLGQPVEGTEETVKSLTKTDLRDWHQQLHFTPLRISIAGKFDPNILTDAVDKLAKTLPKKLHKSARIEPMTINSQKEPIIIEHNVPQTVALFGLPALSRNDPDFYAAYVMNHVLGGGGLTSRLSNAIRQERGLAYYASSYLSPSYYSPVLLGNFATRNENALEAAEVAQNVLQQAVEKGFTQAEVQNAIDFLTGSFPLALDSLASQVNYLSSMQKYELGADYLDKRNDYFQAVTVDDVNRVARKMLAKPPLMVLVGQPKEKP